MDIVVKKRKYVESVDYETSRRNMQDEIPALRDQPSIVGSENSFGEHFVCQCKSNPQSSIATEITAVQTNRAKKFVDHKTSGVDRSLVDRLRNIKQERFKRLSVEISSLQAKQISDDTFVESVRVLDNAFNVTPSRTGKSKNSVHSLGLVPFVMLDRCDNNKMELKNDRRSTEYWSLDEDHEEDIFSDSKDDTENVVEFSQWQYTTNASPDESFCGFSPHQIQSSRDIVIKLSQRDPVDVWSDNDTPPLQGFSSVEQDTSERLANKYKVENPTKAANIVHDCGVASRSGNFKDAQLGKRGDFLSAESESPTNSKDKKGAQLKNRRDLLSAESESPTNFKDEQDAQLGKRRDFLSPEIESPTNSKDKKDAQLEKRGDFLSAEIESPTNSKDKKDAQLEKRGDFLSTEIESPTNSKDNQDNFKSGEPPGFKTVLKPSIRSISICGFSTARGCSISISETALAKAQRIYSDEISTAADEARDFSSEGRPESRNSSKLATHTPSVCGFSTAGGRAINLSKSAVIKAQRAYLELDDFEAGSSGAKAAAAKTEETTSRSIARIGFTTAGGNSLKISAEALSRAKNLYDQETSIVDTALASKNLNSTTRSHDKEQNSSTIRAQTATDFDNIDDDTTSKLNTRVGFMTAGGNHLKISAEALSRAKNLYDQESSIVDTALASKNLNSTGRSHDKEQSSLTIGLQTVIDFDNIEEETTNNLNARVGFTTAGGNHLKISAEALSRAKNLYDQESSIVDTALTSKNLNSTVRSHDVGGNSAPEFDNIKVTTSNLNTRVDFTTAGGNHLKISAEALSRANNLYDQESSIVDTALASKKLNSTDRSHDMEQSSSTIRPHTATDFDNIKETTSNLNARLGFTTAGGNHLKISAEALSRAKNLYAQESSIVDTALASKDLNTTSNNHDIGKSSPTIAAQTATDFDNIESINFDDFVDPVEDDETSRKRKLNEADEETPIRRDEYSKPKRGRYFNDLQARKLFVEDSGTDDNAPTTISKSQSAESAIRNQISSSVNPEKTLIRDEIFASAAALLEDEERSNDGSLWKIGTSSSTEIQKKPETNICQKKSTSPEKMPAENRSLRPVPSPSSKRPTRTDCNSLDVQPESIPDDLTFETQFSQDIQYYPLMDKFINETMKIMEARLAMTCKQDEIIRGKRGTKQQPRDGFLYKLRTSNRDSRISWRTLTKGAAPTPREISNGAIDSDILSVTSASAESYSFRCADMFGRPKCVGINTEGIKVGDDAFLILDENNRAGVREFERAFLAMPGVDPHLVPTGWVKNHYRWIVWKLASMDRVNFNHKCLPRMLTPDRVMFELKYRYDREIFRTQWPPLRRILERNEDASARIVLCVASITVTEENSNAPKGSTTPNILSGTSYKMKLTDGWYSIPACIDAAMVNCIKTGKVREGTKLMTIGAKTLNLDQGCSALEIPVDVSLRIHTNSTRRVKWYTKLDYYHANRGPMLLSLKSIKPNGGMICKLVVAVARLYPILYREKMPDGQFVFRNARQDEEAALAHESRHQSKMDEIYANARKEFQMSLMNRRELDKTRDRTSVEQTSSSYSELEEELRQSITSKLRECLPAPRDVTPVMKIRIAEGEASAILTVWSSDHDTTEIFVEGSSIAIYNAFASRPRLNELHITASRSSFMKRETKRRIDYPERIFTSLTDIAEPGFSPVYGEFDTVGIVSSVGAAPHGMKNFETVNLACPRAAEGSASSFLSILFWQGISTHGYSKILTVGSLVACSNLEWRRNTVKSIPTAYCTERSVFTKNPRQRHLLAPFDNLRGQIQKPFAYASACAAVIEEEIAKKSGPRTPGSGTPYRPATTSNLTPGWTPRDSRNNCTPVIDSRKTSMKRRLEKLEAYGEAPKLPSIVVDHGSRKVLSDFRSPVSTPVTKS